MISIFVVSLKLCFKVCVQSGITTVGLPRWDYYGGITTVGLPLRDYHGGNCVFQLFVSMSIGLVQLFANCALPIVKICKT